MAYAQLISSIVGAAGNTGTRIAGAYGQRMMSKARVGSYLYNAEILEQNADLIAAARDIETERMIEGARELKAKQRASYSKSGAAIDSGTPLIVVLDQASKVQKDILQHRRNRMIEEQGMRHQADMQRWNAAVEKSAGKAAKIQSIIGIFLNSDAGDIASNIPQSSVQPTTQLQQPQLDTLGSGGQSYKTMINSY